MLNFITDGYSISREETIKSITNYFLDLSKLTDDSKFYFLESKYDQIVLQEIYEALETLGHPSADRIEAANGGSDFNPIAIADDALLNLMLMGSMPTKYYYDGEDEQYKVLENVAEGEDFYYKKLAGIKKETVAGGLATYQLVEVEGTDAEKYIAASEAGFTKDTAVAGMALQQLALAIMYSKVCVQNVLLKVQMSQIDKMNEAVQKNNEAQAALSILYDKAFAIAIYEDVTSRGPGVEDQGLEWHSGTESVPGYAGKLAGDIEITGSYNSETGRPYTLVELQTYLTDLKVGLSLVDGNLYVPIGHYNKDGDYTGNCQADSVENVDVDEQGCLDMIFRQQEAVRMYGDQLSTDSQLMTTKMNQYLQSVNNCISVCTQVVRGIGDYLKSTVSNVR